MSLEAEKLEGLNTQNEAVTIIKSRYNYSRRSAYAQVLATLIQNWLLIEIGLDTAMTTMVIGALHLNSAEALSMNDEQASWFGSLPFICHPLASLLLSGYFQDKFGRRTTMILVTIPTFIAWVSLYFAQSMYVLYLVSAVTGMCTGLTEAPLHSYIGEIGEPHLRGTLSSISTSAVLVGIFMMYVFCYLFTWRTVALICSACPVITFTCMTQIPESPTWLIVKNRLEDARKSLCWLRGWVDPSEVEEEFQALVSHARNSVQKNKAAQSVGDGLIKKDSYLKTQFKEMTSKRVLLPLRLILIVFVFREITTFSAIRPYLIGELNKLHTPINAKLVLILSEVLVFIGAMMNVVCLRRLGKRKIAIFANGIVAICILGTGIYCSFLQDSTRFPQAAWLPVIFWLMLSLFCGFSATLLPWQLVCEIFPIVGRGLATGITAGTKYLIQSAMVKSYLFIETYIGLSGMMYLYGTGAVLGVIHLYFCLPETEGKTLQQIESYFTKNHDRKEKFSVGTAARAEPKV
nr:PREDICTED: facilitated trehalose transporter Tret1-like isoform X2 [Bemisia tabaci]